LCVEMHVSLRRADGEITLSGELASVCALAPLPLPALRGLAEAPEAGQAHLSFFDHAYFHGKRSAPTRRYRTMARSEGARAGDAAGEGQVEVVHAGGALP